MLWPNLHYAALLLWWGSWETWKRLIDWLFIVLIIYFVWTWEAGRRRRFRVRAGVHSPASQSLGWDDSLDVFLTWQHCKGGIHWASDPLVDRQALDVGSWQRLTTCLTVSLTIKSPRDRGGGPGSTLVVQSKEASPPLFTSHCLELELPLPIISETRELHVCMWSRPSLKPELLNMSLAVPASLSLL